MLSQGLLGTRSLLLLSCVVAAFVLAACTTTPPDAQTTSTIAPTPQPTIPGSDADALPPPLPDPDDVAAEAAVEISGYRAVEAAGVFENDALTALRLWLPTQLVAGTAAQTLADAQGNQVVALWVNPIMTWRGDPGLVPALADLDGDGSMVSNGVYRTTTEAGLTVHLWSTGDGFVAAAAVDPQAAETYLVALEAQRQPLPVWETGSCLYFNPPDGLPWAPVALDAVVPCDGAHNAEVLAAVARATGLEAYDDDAIAYQRNYECDAAYERAIGPQRDHAPSLITYMPDENEFDRGDRYLACIIEWNTIDGPKLMSDKIADRDDLAWEPTVGSCFVASLAPDGVPCDQAHVYEYVGEATTPIDTWPNDPTAAFAAACTPLVDGLPPGPRTIDVFPMGLYAYAFEQGERRIRCMAFATDDDGAATVIGSFTDVWRILGSGGIPA